MTSAPLVQHRAAPTRDVADSAIRRYGRAALPHDRRERHALPVRRLSTYDPSPHLEKLTARVLAINSADDFVNPPELGLVERLMRG